MSEAPHFEITPMPQPHEDEIFATLSVLFTKEDVVELRAFPKGRKRTDAGYFDGQHWPQLAEHAARLSASGAAVYVTLNPVDPQLLSRYSNRIEGYAQSTTTDKQVMRRRWLLVDIDPVRPSGTSATDAQLEAAKAKARQVYAYLNGIGWPAPLVAESGNGMHLLYGIDLPNDDDTLALVKAVLIALGERFDDAQTKVDRAVFNAARICKLYGTLANKGDHTPMAPWRISRLLKTPARAVVTIEQLRHLVPPATPNGPEMAMPMRQSDRFNLEGFLTGHGLAYTADRHNGSERFKLAACPFNPAHGKGEAAIFRKASGALGFKCQHDSCSAKTWRDVRDLLDGPLPTRPQEGDTARRGETFPPLEAADDSDAWPDPLPLVDSLTPEAYPLDALPIAMREAVLEVQAFAQAPLAMVATSALSALSMAAQALHDVKRAEKLTGPIGLFTLVLADSGERKTTCDEFFMPVIRKWQLEQEQAMRPQIENHQAALDAWNAERDGILAKIKESGKNGKPTDVLKRNLADLQAEKPEPPRVPRLIYSDITPEELGYQLAKRWPSAAITASEGGTVLGGHGMTGDSAMRNMARLNDLWSGQEISSDRRTSESWVARGARLTMGLQVQESTLRSFFDRSAGLARGTGFLARFLVAWPQSTQGTRLFKDAPGQWPKLAAYHQRIERILSMPTPIDDDGALTPSLIPLSPEAKALWVEYHDEVETRLVVGGEYADVRDVASKSADNAARLAALFHIFEYGGGGAVGEEMMEAGCMVAAWHLQESRRFFGEIAVPIEMADAMRLIRWAVEYGRDQGGTLTTRDLQRLGPVRNKDRLDAALRQLQDHHHVRLRAEGKRKLMEINPALWEAKAP